MIAATVRGLWPLVRDFLPRFLFGVVLILSTTGVEILGPILIGQVVDIVASPSGSVETLRKVCFVYLGLLVVKLALDTAQAFVIQSTGQSVTHRLRSRLFEKTLSLPVAYFDANPAGRLVTRVINDIKALSELFTASISVIALDVFIILGSLGAMLFLHTKLALLVLATFPLVPITIHLFGKKLAEAYRRVRGKLSEMNGFLGENIAAIATIQRLGAESERQQKFDRILDEHQKAQMDSLRVFATVQPIANILNGVSMAVLLGVGGLWVLEGQMTIGVMAAFLGYLRNLFQPIRDLVEKYNTFLSASVSAERVSQILAEKPEAPGGTQEPTHSLAVDFHDVDFTYATREQAALKRVSFHVPAGTSLAIVGATGSGKSTLIRLLLRFYDPMHGEIRVGGISLKEWSLPHLRTTVSVVHQDIYLFEGTVRDNLTLGRVAGDDARLEDYCRRVQLWPYLESRGGLDMALQEGGANLSVGEKQLLALARVLVMDSPILVLDEATSSVDPLIERRLMQALDEALRGRTSLVIAHRLSTIRHCDRLLVLDHGVVAEEGTFDQLMEKQGLFARFQALA